MKSNGRSLLAEKIIKMRNFPTAQIEKAKTDLFLKLGDANLEQELKNNRME